MRARTGETAFQADDGNGAPTIYIGRSLGPMKCQRTVVRYRAGRRRVLFSAFGDRLSSGAHSGASQQKRDPNVPFIGRRIGRRKAAVLATTVAGARGLASMILPVGT